jgi:hypothetical protein
MSDFTPALVKCQNCGFLCVRSNHGELVEVPYEIRQNWPLEHHFWQEHHNQPICFALVLPEQERQQALTSADGLCWIIREGRECASFTPWRQGFTPKEHDEMIQSAELREWQQEEREKERAWLEEQKRRDQEREERLEAEREQRRQEERERDRQWLDQQRLKDQDREEKTRRLQVKWQIINTAIGALLGALLALIVTAVASWLRIK